VATLVINSPDAIQFVNISVRGNKADPAMIMQAGDWQNESGVETGITVDVTGDEVPILTADNARKLAKWLQRAADNLDGVKSQAKKRHKFSYEEDDDTDDFSRRY
jgi:hypothetical protein